jgi:hypothetical protein
LKLQALIQIFMEISQGIRLPIFAMVDNTPNLSPRKPVFPRSLETLKRSGVNITSFSSYVDNEAI